MPNNAPHNALCHAVTRALANGAPVFECMSPAPVMPAMACRVARAFAARFGSEACARRAVVMSRRFDVAARQALETCDWDRARHIGRYRAELIAYSRAV